jgi:hypothetical protein
MKLYITEYETVVGNIVEKNKINITINEFDTGNVLKALISGAGSLLVGDATGSLADLPWVADGYVLTADVAEALKLKWKAPTTVEATMTNRSGVDMDAGTVCILHSTASSVTTTTIASDRRVFCITAEAIPDLNTGRVIFYGIVTVKVTGAVAIGQWLVSSASVSRAKASGYIKPIGAIGMAITANASGDGTVSCVLAIDWYLSISAGKGYLQGNYAASTLFQILNFITETAAGGTALPGNATESMGLSSPTTGYLIAATSFKTPFATDTPAASANSNLPTALIWEGTRGVSDVSKGFVAGGVNGGAVSFIAHKNTFATEVVVAVAGANLTGARGGVPAVTDSLKGYFVGGCDISLNPLVTADKLTLATETTVAMVSANLATARNAPAAISNIGVCGYLVGGKAAAGKSALVSKITYATDTSSVSATLNTAIAAAGGLSGANMGYKCGGSDGLVDATNITGVVERISFATDAWAALAGAALPANQTNAASMSTIN